MQSQFIIFNTIVLLVLIMDCILFLNKPDVKMIHENR